MFVLLCSQAGLLGMEKGGFTSLDGFTTGGLLFVGIVLHLIFFLLTGTKSSGVVRSFFRHLFQLEWKRLIEEAVRIEQGQGIRFPTPKRSWARQCDAHGNILETETTR